MGYYLAKQGSKNDYFYKEYMVDSFEDIETIDKDNCCAGSIAYIISDGDLYMLNTKKEWIKQ